MANYLRGMVTPYNHGCGNFLHNFSQAPATQQIKQPTNETGQNQLATKIPF